MALWVGVVGVFLEVERSVGGGEGDRRDREMLAKAASRNGKCSRGLILSPVWDGACPAPSCVVLLYCLCALSP